MILPSVSTKNFMIRAPWIKGLLGVFDFKKFIEAGGCSPIIKDIYGREHAIIKEDIQVIFTKSQFKMYKYYDSWDEYKESFKKYLCSAGKCNVEEDRIPKAKINYQMLQTLTNITDEEIDLLTQPLKQEHQNYRVFVCPPPSLPAARPSHLRTAPLQKIALLMCIQISMALIRKRSTSVCQDS